MYVQCSFLESTRIPLVGCYSNFIPACMVVLKYVREIYFSVHVHVQAGDYLNFVVKLRVSHFNT